MVRAIKKTVRAMGKGECAVLLPGASAAEPWESWIVGVTGAECAHIGTRPGESPWRHQSSLALPVAQVYCQPLWLNQNDPKQIPGMLPLQLELRGLQPRTGTPAVSDFSVIAQEKARTLVVVGILPHRLPTELEAETYKAFDLSARFLPLEENALTLWIEHDCWVAAVTRGPHLLYFQNLGRDRIGPEALQDLGCILESLEGLDMLLPLSRIVVWSQLSPPELALLEGLHLPIKQGERPPPRPPSTSWKLVPAAVTEARQGKDARRWRLRMALVGIAVYGLVVAWLVSQLFIVSKRANDLQEWLERHTDALSAIQHAEGAWRELRPVVDENNYPLELLLHTAQAIPSEGLHLTLFETQQGHLLIKGEAKNVAGAFSFLDRLKKDPAFSDYGLEMAQPHLLPNDLAQFQIEGTRGSEGGE